MPDNKILVITNLFHSSPRIPRLLKYLKSENWHSTVITPRMPEDMDRIFNAPPKEFETWGIRLIQTGDIRSYEFTKSKRKSSFVRRRMEGFARIINSSSNKKVKRLIKKYYWRIYCTLHFPDIDKHWEVDALNAANKLLESEKFDLILSSSSPIITHIIASKLKRKFGMPWIAEYRDLWTLNHNYQLGRIMRYFDYRLEKRTVSSADAIITMTEPWVEDLKKIFPEKNIVAIMTGFDPEEMPRRGPLTSSFTITYTGQFYSDRQNPYLLLDAVKELVENGLIRRELIQIRFFGPKSDELQRYSTENGLDDIIHQGGVIARNDSMIKQMESQILFYPNWEDPKQKGVPSLKLIEYLAARRPILLTGGVPDNYMSNVVRETSAGDIALTISDVKNMLLAYYDEFLRTGQVAYKGVSQKIKGYDIEICTGKYANLMNDVIHKYQN